MVHGDRDLFEPIEGLDSPAESAHFIHTDRSRDTSEDKSVCAASFGREGGWPLGAYTQPQAITVQPIDTQRGLIFSTLEHERDLLRKTARVQLEGALGLKHAVFRRNGELHLVLGEDEAAFVELRLWDRLAVFFPGCRDPDALDKVLIRSLRRVTCQCHAGDKTARYALELRRPVGRLARIDCDAQLERIPLQLVDAEEHLPLLRGLVENDDVYRLGRLAGIEDEFAFEVELDEGRRSAEHPAHAIAREGHARIELPEKLLGHRRARQLPAHASPGALDALFV